ncbi:hypothetical protein MRX96_037252 [Rhipicephalus microplus]
MVASSISAGALGERRADAHPSGAEQSSRRALRRSGTTLLESERACVMRGERHREGTRSIPSCSSFSLHAVRQPGLGSDGADPLGGHPGRPGKAGDGTQTLSGARLV